jgi:hypothetical protein
MRSARILILMVSLALVFALGCTTETAGVDPDSLQMSTSSVEQGIGGGDDFCSGWTGCYRFCRRLYKCTSQAGCDLLGTCLTGCDNSYPSAPGSCPYPE